MIGSCPLLSLYLRFGLSRVLIDVPDTLLVATIYLIPFYWLAGFNTNAGTAIGEISRDRERERLRAFGREERERGKESCAAWEI